MITNVIDKELKGVAMVFRDGPLEIFEFARKAQKASYYGNPGYIGNLSDEDWNKLGKADPEKVAKVQAFVEEIGDLDDFSPPSLQKRRSWDETTGEMNLDRALNGDDVLYRRAKKKPYHGPTNITILANLDGHHSNTSESIFWRGAMATALCQTLDELGFTVSLWSWNVGHSVYQYPYPSQFTACNLKHAGEDLDVVNLMNCLTAWFMRRVMFATFAGGAHPCKGIGGAHYQLGLWDRYMDIEDDHIIHLPEVFDREDTVRKTVKELNRIKELC